MIKLIIRIVCGNYLLLVDLFCVTAPKKQRYNMQFLKFIILITQKTLTNTLYFDVYSTGTTIQRYSSAYLANIFSNLFKKIASKPPNGDFIIFLKVAQNIY